MPRGFKTGSTRSRRSPRERDDHADILIGSHTVRESSSGWVDAGSGVSDGAKIAWPIFWVSGRAGSSGSVFLLGSHLDTVRNAGRFDGSLGVVSAIEAVEILGISPGWFCLFPCGGRIQRRRRCPVSKCLHREQGVLRTADPERADAAGSEWPDSPGSLGAMERDRIYPAARSTTFGPRHLAGFLEVHLEQGPVLESEGLALGVVTAVAGQLRCRLTWTGKASHAGTTPAPLRRDALAGAAEFIREVEKARKNSAV